MALVFLYFLFSFPYIYLIYEWNGIFPPSHAELHDLDVILWDNIIYTITIMAIYFLPFIFLNNNGLYSFKKILTDKIFLGSFILILIYIIK